MADTLTKDGYTRIVYRDAVHWVVEGRRRRIEYCIVRFPFVPDYHLCDMLEDVTATMTHPYIPAVTERPLQQFKTLTQALAVLRVIIGSRP
jgi:hypothetical protein